MNTYELIVEFIRSGLDLSGQSASPFSLRSACLNGTLPVSYRQALRVKDKAQANGDLKLTRAQGQQGRPLQKVSDQ